MEEIIIRHYRESDRDSVRGLAWDTAFMGEPADRFFSSKDLLADFLTKYFTDYEPGSCFVACDKSGVVGYLLGAKDNAAAESIFRAKILPGLLRQAVVEGHLLKRKNIVFLYYLLISLLKLEFVLPDAFREYPAILHINVKAGYRDKNTGSRLIGAYFEYLAKENIRGVRLATMSDKAEEFFKKCGFNLLFKCKRSYFRHILRNDVPVYIFGKVFR